MYVEYIPVAQTIGQIQLLSSEQERKKMLKKHIKKVAVIAVAKPALGPARNANGSLPRRPQFLVTQAHFSAKQEKLLLGKRFAKYADTFRDHRFTGKNPARMTRY